MAKKNTKPAKSEKSEGPGRATKAINQERLDHILKRTKEEPGVASRDLAGELEITTLQCSQLGDRLVKSGAIALHKLASGQRTYYEPKVYARKEASLKKQFDKDMEARAAKTSKPAKAKPAKTSKPAAKTSKPAAKTSGKKKASKSPAK